jgi:hypothetical protein
MVWHSRNMQSSLVLLLQVMMQAVGMRGDR